MEVGVAVVSGKRHRERLRRVFKRAVLLSVPLKWASTSADSAAQCRYEPMLHAPFFQATQAR